MTNFDVSKTGISSATVYAFRFTDSPTVSIECFVFICTSVNCEVSANADPSNIVKSNFVMNRQSVESLIVL